MAQTAFKSLITAGALLWANTAFAKEDCLRFAAHETGFISTIAYHVGRALDQAGICHQFYPPASPEVVELNKRGKLTGELLRVQFYDRVTKLDVVMVPTPLASGKGFVLALKNTGITTQNYQEYRIGYLRDTVWHKLLIDEIPKSVEMSSYKELIRALNEQRIDGFLVDGVVWQAIKGQFAEATLLPVMNLSGHTWLKMKHKDKVAQINKAYADYIAQGNRFTDSVKPVKKAPHM
ncbi:hypothetical protein [Terasakiella sp. SH-1]|uniref:hypothetical protein n=1 Tax=Terasakiella sp. SH-1 TaxID=2560057 RepID=UPI00107330F5|nr:hypothetical protein [Terasakiella sp. SH-1]